MDATASPHQTPEEVAQEFRHKSVLYLRHRLQKIFHTPHGQPPVVRSFPDADRYFTKLEKDHVDLRSNDPVFKSAKIQKVLKIIHFYQGEIPHDEMYKFRIRAGNLLRLWGFEEDKWWDPVILGLEP